MKHVTLQISKITIDPSLQARTTLHQPTIDDYAVDYEVGADFPPIDVFDDKETLWLADGFHRIEGAKRSGLVNILANVHEGTRIDAVLFACAANKTHGLRRTRDDKIRAINILLDCLDQIDGGKKWSIRQIADHCGVVHQTVSNAIEKRKESCQVAIIATEAKHKQTTNDSNSECKSSKNEPATDPEPEPVLDKIGRVIPNEILPLWERAAEVNADLTSISNLRSKFKKLQDHDDPLYRQLNHQGIVSDLSNAYRAIKSALPFTVCPGCQGLTRNECKLCCGRGFINALMWESGIPTEQKDMILKSIKK